jgi:hypothetical protein
MPGAGVVHHIKHGSEVEVLTHFIRPRLAFGRKGGDEAVGFA